MFGEILKKVFRIQEDKTTTVEPGTEPATTPEAPPAPERPSTPIRPKPGVTPKPKAKVQDIYLFMKNRDVKTEEQLISPDKAEWIESMDDEELKALFPDLSDSEENYLKLITSEQYEDMVERIQRYSGIEAIPENLPALVGLMQAAGSKAMKIEKGHKPALEELAVNTVLGLNEFKMVEEAYVNDEIKIKAKLGQQRVEPPAEGGEGKPPEGKLSELEQLNQELAGEFDKFTEAKARRRLANLLIQGGALLKSNLFHMVESKLNAIDPELIKLYGLLVAFAELGYWVTPFGVEEAAVAAQKHGGETEAKPEGDKYVISASGVVFPYLIHELVKGVYEWISIDPEMQNVMGQETVSDETKDLLAGPGVFKRLFAMLPSGKDELWPLVQKKLLQQKPADIKDILSQSASGKSKIDDLVKQAESEWSEYQKKKEEYSGA